jgi:hypothetical protein
VQIGVRIAEFEEIEETEEWQQQALSLQSLKGSAMPLLSITFGRLNSFTFTKKFL